MFKSAVQRIRVFMSEIKFTVTSEQAGLRLDYLVSENVEDLTRSNLKSRNIPIQVNGKTEKISYKVKPNDKILLDIPEIKPLKIVPQSDVEFELLYSDKDIAVVNKPAGLTVHPSHGHEDGTLVNGLLYKLQGRLSSIGGVERPGIVHRLDKDTAGLLIIALTDRAHHALSSDFKNRNITKIYQAVVKGNPPESGRIEEPIGRAKRNRKKMAIVPDGKPSVTEYSVLRQLNHHAYVKVNLLTGRTHQIRVHFAHIGYPIAGDVLYSCHPGKYKLQGLALCASEIRFNHPVSGEEMHFKIDLPEDIQALVARFL